MSKKTRRRVWLRLDNAAKIFPASLREGWSNVFRLSFSLSEPVDPQALERALARVSRRFPSVFVSLHRGMFWYYLEENADPPQLRREGCQPLLPMSRKEIGTCAIRVLYYENRIAMEVFHALTDGTGAMTVIKTLAAAYLEERTGQSVPRTHGVLDPDGKVLPEELEDAFLRYAGGPSAPREKPDAFHLIGQPEPDGFLHVTTFCLSASEIARTAKERGISVTALVAAALTESISLIQKEKSLKERAVRVQIPVNLRAHFPSVTVRNFVSVFNVGLEKGECDADFDEICHRIHHQMALMNTPRHLRKVFTANVNSEKGIGIRLVPLFLKNIVMRAVFDQVGESSACLCLSNLGRVSLPEEMTQRITEFDFIIGPQARAPYNCAMLSYGDTCRINLVRNTKKPELEQRFFEQLSRLGLSVTLQSNER